MTMDPSESSLSCESCGGNVTAEDPFCPSCGSLFTDLLVCVNHPFDAADGVCVVCSQPFCSLCGASLDKRFVCAPHARDDIHEEMARVFWNRGILEAQLATSYLEEAGLHPFTIASIDVYVPFPEVLRVENILKDTGLAPM